MLMILIDFLDCLSILIFLFDMYVHIVVYLVVLVLTPLLVYYLDHL